MEKKEAIAKPRELGIYSKILITRMASMHITHMGNNIKELLQHKLSSEIEGKCIVEGYIKPKSVSILTYSSGIVQGHNIIFEIVFECQACLPVEGMHIKCIAKNITKAGIRAEITDGVNKTPLVIFIARDHHTITPYFNSIKEQSNIVVRVIGQRFELNDNYICVIAELIQTPSHLTNKTTNKSTRKKKLVIV